MQCSYKILIFIICFLKFSNSLKNVLFIIADDLRPAISGYHDRLAKTPNIDRFMSKSFHFTRAFCQQSLCAPSRNSMLTSRRPDTLRLYDFYNYWRTFAGNFTTLPQYFKEHGYNTYSVGKIFHPGISSNYTDDYPFSWTEKPFHPKTDTFANSPVCSDGTGQLKSNLICPVRLADQPGKTLPDIESMQEAKRILNIHNNETLNNKQPFFLAVGFHKPHIPFKFPRKYLQDFPLNNFDNVTNTNYMPINMPSVAWNPFTDIRARDDLKNLNIPFPFGPIPKLYRMLIWQAYYSSVAYIDHLFGEILTEVNWNNTIVILTSDHGWSLGEHGEWAKYSNFEVAVKIPLIVYSPDFVGIIKNNKTIKNIVELIDIFPSLVDLVDLPKLPKCSKYLKRRLRQKTCTEGKSFYGIIQQHKNITLNNNVALSQYPRPGQYPTQKPNSDKPKLKDIQIMGYSIRTNNFRYTLWIEFNSTNFTKNWNMIYGEELYDHRMDHDENFNLVSNLEFKNLTKRLQQKLIHRFS